MKCVAFDLPFGRSRLVRPGNLPSLVIRASGCAAVGLFCLLSAFQAWSADCVTPPAGLVSWWPGEGNANDIVGTNNGTLYNGVGFAPGVVGQAFSFNGSSNSYVEVADSPALQLTNAVTIECWAKRLNTAEVHILVEKGGDWTGGQTDYELGLNDTDSGGSHFGFSFAGGWRGCAVTPDTAWHHYAAVAANGQANPILYIDGVPQPIVYSGGPSTMDLFASTRALHIGAQLDPQTGWFKYSDTVIDELSIYSRALTAAEIQAIYNAGSAGKCRVPVITSQPQGQTAIEGSTVTFVVLVGGLPPLSYQWQFDSTNIAGATASSLTLTNVQPGQAGNYLVVVSNAWGVVTSSNAVLAVIPPTCEAPPSGLVAWWPGEGSAVDIAGTNNGTLYNGVGFVPGMVRQAFSFNGTNSYVEVPDSPSLRLTNDLTIEFWVKRQRLSGIEVLLEKGGDWTGAQCDYEVVLHDSRENYCLFLTYTGGLQGGGQIADYNWHHCAVTAHNGSTNVGIYVDGALQPISFTDGSTTVALTPSTRPLHIGAQLDPVTGWYYYSETCVDEMSLYDRMLSATEIQALYNAGSAGKCRSLRAATASPVLAYDFVVAANITDGGYGYTHPPTVKIIGGGGSGAQAVAVVSNGVVVAINVLDAGYGYTSAPIIVIEPPIIPQPKLGVAAMSLLSFSNLDLSTNYQLQSFLGNTWSNLGTAFTAAGPTFTQFVSGTADLSDYRLAAFPVPQQAYATAQLVNGFVVGATVASGGSGYVTNPAVAIIGGGGSNATAVANISGGAVTSITITAAGSGYTNTPTIQIAPPPPPAVTMSPTVLPVMRLDSANLAPYENYQIQYKSDLGGAWEGWSGGLFSPTGVTNSQYLLITNGAGFFRLEYVP